MIWYYLCYLTGVDKSGMDNNSNITCFDLPLGLLIGFTDFLQELPNRPYMLGQQIKFLLQLVTKY